MASHVKIEDATDHHVDGADLSPEAGNLDVGVDNIFQGAPGGGLVLVKVEETPRDSTGKVSTRSSTTASGYSTRRRWSNQNDARPSPTPRALPASDRVPPKRKKRNGGIKPACGRDTCGEESAEGVPVCSACHLPCTQSGERCHWKHFQSDEAVANAGELWSREMAKPTPPSTAVNQAFRPSRDSCFCNRGNCFFGMVLKWQAKSPRKCAVCCVSHTRSSWRRPGTSVRLHQRYFSSVHAKCQRLRETGGTLASDSWMCNACHAEGVRKAPIAFRGDKSTIEGYLNLLELHRPTRSNKTEAFAEHVTLLHFLRNLKEGGNVHLREGVDTMRNAREEAGLASMDEQTLVQKVSGMFKELSSCVEDASQISCTSDILGEGDSLCLVPSRVNPQYAACLHRSERSLETEAGNRDPGEGGVVL